VVVGARCPELIELLVEDFRRRTGGRIMDLMTSDEYAAYPGVILSVYGEQVVPQPTGKPGRPRLEYRRVPDELVYATVHKVRENYRVVAVEERLIYGTPEQLQEALANSAVGERSRRSTSSGTTGRIGSGTPGKFARRIGSVRTGRFTRR
jgi:hypothetical protein